MLCRNIIIVLLISFMGLSLIGCYKDKTVISDTGAEITKTISFASDITPILNKSCNCNTSGCHSSGGQKPDLSAANAFTSLTSGNYVTSSDPQSSILYQWMTGKKSTPMPVSGVNKDYNAIVLAWIKQGTQNN
jgi:hypothetical protein